MKKIKIYVFFLFILINFNVYANDSEFNEWKKNFKLIALENGVSLKMIESTIDKSIFLKNVIKYDRYQPEFYEDTKTYISKRANNKKVNSGLKIYKINKTKIDKITREFSVDKDLLLSLMGIETNFGNYLGKMDIVSSLATLSYDKRRSEFFTSELLTLLILFDKGIINPNNYLGSWAGAFGNFQFMPSTIKNYAIDHNEDEIINLKNIEDSFASAANYLNKIGWDNKTPCFYKVELINETPHKYLNTSAKQIKHKNKVSYLKKYIKNSEKLDDLDNLKAAIVTPDYDIIPDAQKLTPAYLVFDNYELILKWNRSLRFALAVCTLKNKFKNAI
ncbi:lytic murein transglycosylase [Pelagibacterales bacterium SAG-MED23]|nr:lytic murein transglycosylase [Pelagibacterales bacterium SAG-MED23]